MELTAVEPTAPPSLPQPERPDPESSALHFGPAYVVELSEVARVILEREAEAPAPAEQAADRRHETKVGKSNAQLAYEASDIFGRS
ncbi:MAG: hypothetical protein AAGA48_04555 [Myxococcota bacterium]